MVTWLILVICQKRQNNDATSIVVLLTYRINVFFIKTYQKRSEPLERAKRQKKCLGGRKE